MKAEAKLFIPVYVIIGTFRICEQQKTMLACTLTQSRQIMFECLSTCERQDVLPTFEKND